MFFSYPTLSPSFWVTSNFRDQWHLCFGKYFGFHIPAFWRKVDRFVLTLTVDFEANFHPFWIVKCIFFIYCCSIIYIIIIFLFLKLDVCRILEFKSAMKGYNLQGHIFKSVEVKSETDCDVNCYLESDCISFNVVTSPTDGTITCELSNSDHETHPEDLRRQFGAVYQPIKVKGITFSEHKRPCYSDEQ